MASLWQSDVLRLSDRIFVAPVIHGSGDFAVEVRRLMLAERIDCLAVPLPRSFQEAVETGIEHLPAISVAVQEEPRDWSAEVSGDLLERDDDDDHNIGRQRVSYVPIDPCQPVIAALRVAAQERIARHFIDVETTHWQAMSAVLPDAYALKKVTIDQFAAAALPALRQRPPEGFMSERLKVMAQRLRQLEQRHRSILFVCSLAEWTWIKEAYAQNLKPAIDDEDVEPAELMGVTEGSLLFLLGELPFLTALYEQARAELDDDENLSVDGLKHLMLAAREHYRHELKSLARKVSPKLLATYFQYVRNLSLIERRLTPDLYTLIRAAQQILGDQFAIALAEVARWYPVEAVSFASEFRLSTDRGQLPDGRLCEPVTRLPGHPVHWRSLQLNRKPPKIDQQKWRMQWNPFRQCSWPPEDVAIEKFRNHVKDAALALLGADLAKTEKFSTSLKDGLDIRETLRNWHTGDLYVKVFPPQLGNLDCVLMFFDSPADPRDYPWRITWVAEHEEESTLALFATSFYDEMVGPGIGLSKYGGAMFLFPPREIPEVWSNKQLDFTDTMEERLLAAACLHAEERHIAILSEAPPGLVWKRIAQKFGKKLVHVPMGRFSQETIQQLRMVHVLNGREVRSFASHFIRRG